MTGVTLVDIALAKRNILSRVGNTRRVTVGSLLRYKNLWQYVYLYIYIYILYKYSYLPMSNTVVSCNKPHRQWNRIGLASAESTRRFLLAVQSPLSERRKKKNHRVWLLWCVAFVCSCAALSIYTVLYSASPKRLVLWHCTSICLSIYPFIYPSTNSFLVETQAPIASLASVNPFHNLST